MTYVALITYHPDVGTFRGHRGAWRVHSCYKAPYDVPVRAMNTPDLHRPRRCIQMPVARELKPGVWCNPTRLLKDYQQQRRSQCTDFRRSTV